MNLQRRIITAAAGAAAIGLLSAGSAQAFTFGNEGILFEEDTTLNFEFLQSHGYWYGDFGVKNLSSGMETILISESLNVDPGSGVSNDNLGTEGVDKAVEYEEGLANFTFSEGTEYTFFLNSYDKIDGTRGELTRTVYSTSSLNPSWWDTSKTITENDYDDSFNGRTVNARDRVLFEGDLFSGLNLFFEDNGIAGDNDYDDFIVSASAAEVSVPEPTMLLGLGVVTGAMAFSRRRKEKQAS
ncbi:PEP-CTERM sorting domain-containing protein [Phormidium sp. CCY1219]|uniref:PEP-CTERM sorting domain-containing protein n=1 Tax=Phormidium sp. CCY1219 TaxID=2886104 RepID=UPI002D1F8B30|nr:PEP-CTERM sorting domain-containing protein [Phormidium sp. CCY1219]MEB3829849.1 PEP-CTERM sorting domain-containing protein [Phormidium sp. CCY1219]